MKAPLSSRTVKLEASELVIRLVIDEITNTTNIDSDNSLVMPHAHWEVGRQENVQAGNSSGSCTGVMAATPSVKYNLAVREDSHRPRTRIFSICP